MELVHSRFSRIIGAGFLKREYSVIWSQCYCEYSISSYHTHCRDVSIKSPHAVGEHQEFGVNGTSKDGLLRGFWRRARIGGRNGLCISFETRSTVL